MLAVGDRPVYASGECEIDLDRRELRISFAQFEREVTGERICDKIAASKQKGMWMGGVPPLGYAVRERKLIIVEPEAETVRHIFRRYAALGSVRLLQRELETQGITGKS